MGHMDTANPDKQIKTCLIYVRISDFGSVEDALSPEVQIEIAQKEKEKRKLVLLEPPYQDLGKTGTTLDRPGLQNMLARCMRGGVDAIIVQDTSRLSRNTADYIAIKAMLQKEGVSLISINQPSASKNDPYSSFVDEVIAATNALHPRVTSFKVKLTANSKFNFGWYPGPAPIGYKNVKNNTPSCQLDRKIIVPDEKKDYLIKLLFKKYGTGQYNLFKLGKVLQKKGLTTKSGNPLAHSTLNQILTNPFYYGLMRRNGTKKMGKHEPLISKKLFNLCQLVARKHANFVTRERKHDFLLRGLLFCDKCEQRYTAEWHNINSRSRDKIAYYHCVKRTPCKSSYIESKEMERQVTELLKGIKFTKGFTTKLTIQVMKYLKSLDRGRLKERKALNNKKTAFLVKRGRLEENFLNGHISADAYNRMSAKLDIEINKVGLKLLRLDKTHKLDFDLLKEVMQFTRDIPKTYSEAPDYLKKKYLGFFFQKVLVDDKKIKNVIYSPLINELNSSQQVILRSNRLPEIYRLRNWFLENIEAWKNAWDITLQPTFDFSPTV